MEKRTQFKLDLLGVTFTIQSDEEPKYIESVVNYLKDKVNEIKGNVNVVDPLKISIMAALNVVDELFKEKVKILEAENKMVNLSEIEQITNHLIKQIDDSLVEL